MATDLRSVIAEVVATGKGRPVPDEGIVILPLSQWPEIERQLAHREAAEMGRRLQLDDVDAADIIRRGREERTREQRENLGLR